jgi:hypothetical protein
MPTRTISYGCSGQTLGNTITCTGTVTELQETIPPSSTNLAITLAIDVSEMKGLYMVGTGAMTVKTNSTGSPANTIALVADQPLVWTSVSLLTSPLGTDVTILYITSTPGGVFSLTVIQDATP